MTTDPETGESGPQKVVATIVGQGEKNLVEVTVDVDGDAGDAVSTITATAEHPFWVDDHGRLLQPAAHGPWGEGPGWYDAADLDPGDQLRTPTGDHARITDIRAYTATTRVHNLTINGIHTYHVVTGETPVFVHNCGGSSDSVSRRDVHGEVQGKARQIDVDYVIENGDLYIDAFKGNTVRVLDRGDGTSDIVIRDPSNSSGRSVTSFNAKNGYIESRLESGEWE